MNIYVYMLEWHINSSPAFHRIFINEIRKVANIIEVSWDGKTVRPEWSAENENDVFVFCQKHPPKNLVKFKNSAKVIWIPMWNNVLKMDQKDWNSIPKNFKILAYTPLISQRSLAAGLQTLLVKYVPHVDVCDNVNLGKKRVLYYWNRVGLVDKTTLIDICKALKVDKLLFRPNLDPGIPSDRSYTITKDEIGIDIEEIPVYETAEEASLSTKQANIIIAPRPFEGVGLFFLEAMAEGKVVLSLCEATMSEYIEHKKTGYFLEQESIYPANNNMLSLKVSANQKWADLEQLDLDIISANAKNMINDCQARWNNDLLKIRNYVTDWSSLSTYDPNVTEQGISELHRMAFDYDGSNRFRGYFIKALRQIRQQLHPINKEDLRIVSLRMGTKICLNVSEGMGGDLYYGLFEEQNDFRLFMAALSVSDTVIDVGANVGIYSIAAAQCVGAGGSVLSFEPGEAANKLLNYNVTLNDFGNRIKTFMMCVGATEGDVLFNVNADTALSGIEFTDRGKITAQKTTPLITLDAIIQRLNLTKADAVKIDVEGYEYAVLNGAMQTILNSDAIIMFEISNKNLTIKLREELITALTKITNHGYNIVRISPHSSALLKTFNSPGKIFLQPTEMISGNYFLARNNSGKYNKLVSLHEALYPMLIQNKYDKIFPAIRYPRYKFTQRHKSILWAQQKRFQIASDLINKLSKRQDFDVEKSKSQ